MLPVVPTGVKETIEGGTPFTEIYNKDKGLSYAITEEGFLLVFPAENQDWRDDIAKNFNAEIVRLREKKSGK